MIYDKLNRHVFFLFALISFAIQNAYAANSKVAKANYRWANLTSNTEVSAIPQAFPGKKLTADQKKTTSLMRTLQQLKPKRFVAPLKKGYHNQDDTNSIVTASSPLIRGDGIIDFDNSIENEITAQPLTDKADKLGIIIPRERNAKPSGGVYTYTGQSKLHDEFVQVSYDAAENASITYTLRYAEKKKAHVFDKSIEVSIQNLFAEVGLFVLSKIRPESYGAGIFGDHHDLASIGMLSFLATKYQLDNLTALRRQGATPCLNCIEAFNAFVDHMAPDTIIAVKIAGLEPEHYERSTGILENPNCITRHSHYKIPPSTYAAMSLFKTSELDKDMSEVRSPSGQKGQNPSVLKGPYTVDPLQSRGVIQDFIDTLGAHQCFDIDLPRDLSSIPLMVPDCLDQFFAGSIY